MNHGRSRVKPKLPTSVRRVPTLGWVAQDQPLVSQPLSTTRYACRGPPDRKGVTLSLFRPRREKAISGADEVGAHEIAGGSSVAFCDRVVNCRMLDEDVLKPVAGALERETVEAHADGNVLLESLHGGREVWVC